MDRFFRCFGLPGALPLTGLLSLLALVLALCFPTPARWLCFAAMLFSSVGDIFLMHLPVIEKHLPNYFVFGAASFMVAHLLYALCFTRLIRRSGAALLNPGAAIMIAIALVLAVWFVCSARRLGRTDQLPLILVYIVMIALSCTTIFSYAWSQGFANPMAILAAVGAVSFFVSDLIIGLGMVMGISRYNHLIWWFYPIGQILMILGVGRG
ncbi:MAG: lysoplasmalogenase [Clostridia bacterium]|nr:lysoplasmalogenase [Clostridia bacterium]